MHKNDVGQPLAVSVYTPPYYHDAPRSPGGHGCGDVARHPPDAARPAAPVLRERPCRRATPCRHTGRDHHHGAGRLAQQHRRPVQRHHAVANAAAGQPRRRRRLHGPRLRAAGDQLAPVPGQRGLGPRHHHPTRRVGYHARHSVEDRRPEASRRSLPKAPPPSPPPPPCQRQIKLRRTHSASRG